MPSVSITWHTQHDDRVCPICQAIDGYIWIFEDSVPDSLIHPEYGEVWNIHIGSLAHEHQLHKGSKYGLISNCRCHTESKITSLKDLADAVRKLKNELKDALGEYDVDDTKSGGYRTTTPEDIGIDLSKYGIE
jgi:hypothetical protein